jgi:hypothetical protein
MHQYIQFILKLRPNSKVPRTQRTYHQVLQTFWEQCPRCSPSYQKVFATLYASRHSINTDEAILDFVSEVERQTWQSGGITDL